MLVPLDISWEMKNLIGVSGAEFATNLAYGVREIMPVPGRSWYYRYRQENKSAYSWVGSVGGAALLGPAFQMHRG